MDAREGTLIPMFETLVLEGPAEGSAVLEAVVSIEPAELALTR